jgi:hypothetical protein
VSPLYVFENNEYGGKNVNPLPAWDVNAALDNVMLVPFTTLAIVVPFGIPAPRTTIPTAKFAVLLKPDTVVVLFVVPESEIAGV